MRTSEDKSLLDIFGSRLKSASRGPARKIDGARMAAIRRLQGISLDMLAGVTGYTPEELRAIETGALAVDQAMLLRLSERLKCRPEDLL